MTPAIENWRVVWAGNGLCRSLAELLADERAVRAGSNVFESLVAARATLLVAGKLPAFDRCSVAVPHDFVPGRVRGVVAAVGGGPHSTLAAATARRLGERLAVPVRVLTGYRSPDLRADADKVLADVARSGVQLPMDAVATDSPPDLVASLPPGTLVVIGAPGGSWFQRQLFGPGVRLRSAAPAGAVVVRQAEPRVYQFMRSADAVGAHMRVRDVLDVTTGPIVPVADFGRLVGMVTRARMMDTPGHVPVGSVAEVAVAVAPDEPVSQVELVVREHQGGPVAVVDDAGRLIGSLGSVDIASTAGAAKEEAS